MRPRQGGGRAPGGRLARQRAEFLGRTRPGPRRLAWLLAAVAAAGLWLAALFAWWPYRPFPLETFARWAHWILRFAAAFPFVFVPVLFAPLFAGEKERGTMEALVLTPLRRETILAGRARAAWRPAGLFLLAVLPLFLFLPRWTWGGHLFLSALPGEVIFSALPGEVIFGRAWAPFIWNATAPPPYFAVNTATVAAGAAAWAWVWVNARALAWTSTALSVRSRTRLAALAWSLLVSAALLALAFGTARGARHLCTSGLWTGPATWIRWELKPTVVGATVAEIGLVGLAGLLVRRVLPKRFDPWAMGREA